LGLVLGLGFRSCS